MVEGTTFAPEGRVFTADGKQATSELRSEPIKRLSEIAALCNDAKIVYDEVCAFIISFC